MTEPKYKNDLPGFTRAEFEHRAERARKLMRAEKLDGLLLTSQQNMEYLSGFISQFPWATPARPWYFLLPRLGQPVAIIPTVGIENWRATSWVKEVRAWRSPNPENEGLDILAATIKDIRRRYGRIGVELGAETRIGMPVGDLLRLRRKVRPFEMVDGTGVMRELRIIKSSAEIARLRRVCQIVCDTFDALPSFVSAGDSEKEIMRKIKAHASARGVDSTSYMMTHAGPGGVQSFIMGPTDRRIRAGDVLSIDAGCIYDGYFSDFDRNFSVGKPSAEIERAHALLHKATDAGLAAARPGNTAEDVFKAQANVIAPDGDAAGFTRMGRFGHGLGRVMTEPPSNMLGDKTVLRPGMALSIEPGMALSGGQLFIHEENVAITEDGCRLLTRRAPKRIPVIPC